VYNDTSFSPSLLNYIKQECPPGHCMLKVRSQSVKMKYTLDGASKRKINTDWT